MGTRTLTAPASPPTIVIARGIKVKDRKYSYGDPVPRRELVIVLMAMTCMTPFCVWSSTVGGMIGIGAAFNDAFYGQYVVLLAAFGLLTMVAGNSIRKTVSKRVIIVGVGLGTVALTVLDLVNMLRYNSGPYTIEAQPGIGMFLALILGMALTLAALVPKKASSHRSASRPVLRPGSLGSDPSAPR